ncbi:hypothetical protein EDB84DRAFT_1443278 [Lactarius hengduanensis]|nr:hypothetical protein EDB84DRAFT_1443278 [Lactarius hengduanensis]
MGWGRVNDGGAGVAVPVVCRVETAPMRRGRVNEAGGDGSRGGSGGRVETAPVQRGSRTHLSGPKCRKRDGDNDVACVHTCERQAGRAARKPRGVKAMGGGLDDEGDTVLACTG